MAASDPYPEHPQLVHYPDPVLRRVAAPVTVFDDALRAFCQRMFEVMERHRGVGLAAPQVGVAKRIFVTNHSARDDEAPPERRVWINPRIEARMGEHAYEEGCLSLPGIYGTVTRPSAVEVVYQDEHGVERRLQLDSGAGDFLAVVIQHELDHLDGILFLDHLSPAQLTMVRRRLRDMEKDYRKATGKAGAVLRR